MYHLEVENRRSKGCLTLFTRRPQGVFETVVGVAKSPGNACSRDAVSREQMLTPLTPPQAGALLPVRKGQRVGVTRGDLSDSVYKHTTVNITKSVLFR